MGRVSACLAAAAVVSSAWMLTSDEVASAASRRGPVAAPAAHALRPAGRTQAQADADAPARVQPCDTVRRRRVIRPGPRRRRTPRSVLAPRMPTYSPGWVEIVPGPLEAAPIGVSPVRDVRPATARAAPGARPATAATPVVRPRPDVVASAAAVAVAAPAFEVPADLLEYPPGIPPLPGVVSGSGSDPGADPCANGACAVPGCPSGACGIPDAHGDETFVPFPNLFDER
jgi:hypothetical protein